jgi:Fic family protein
MLSYQLSPELLAKNQDLENAFLEVYSSLKQLDADELQSIKRYARISNIGASTRIENALLTDSEVNWLDTVLTQDGRTTAFTYQKGLIENKLSKDRERSIEEVAGCRQMLMLIHENFEAFLPLRETDIRALHYQLMAPYQKQTEYIGTYKIQPNFVVEQNHHTQESRVVFQTADAGPMTSAAMSALVAWYNQAHPLESRSILVTSEFVYRFLAIHPFQDGNGRLGRGLFMLNLLQSPQLAISYIAPCLAIDRQIEKHKEEYYFVLSQCSKGRFSQDSKKYEIEHFARFMIKIIKKSLEDIDLYRAKYKALRSLSETAMQILNCFKDYPEKHLTNKIICEETKLPRRTVAYSLATLVAACLLYTSDAADDM